MVDMSEKPSIALYYINLDSAEKRRAAVEKQEQELGLHIQRVSAVVGKELTEADLTAYDKERREREFPFDMYPNEHACTLSHLKVLRLFLESEADYAVVMEDDLLLHPDFNEGLQWATEHTEGWQVIKLFTADGKLYPTPISSPDGKWQLVFPKKISWVSCGTLYSREGARRVLDGFRRYWVPFDVQLAEIMLRMDITVCGITPCMVNTSDPASEDSSIDTAGESRAELVSGAKGRTLLQYLTHRLSVWAVACNKWKMRRRLAHRLRSK